MISIWHPNDFIENPNLLQFPSENLVKYRVYVKINTTVSTTLFLTSRVINRSINLQGHEVTPSLLSYNSFTLTKHAQLNRIFTEWKPQTENWKIEFFTILKYSVTCIFNLLHLNIGSMKTRN